METSGKDAVERYLAALEDVRAGEADAIDEETEAAFVAHAGAYAREHAIEYRTWRAVGVDADVLARAGIRADRR